MVDSDVYRLDSKEKIMALLKNFNHEHYMTDGSISIPIKQFDPERQTYLTDSLLGFEDWNELHRCEQVLKCLNCWDCVNELTLSTNRRFPLLCGEKHSLLIKWRTDRD